MRKYAEVIFRWLKQIMYFVAYRRMWPKEINKVITLTKYTNDLRINCITGMQKDDLQLSLVRELNMPKHMAKAHDSEWNEIRKSSIREFKEIFKLDESYKYKEVGSIDEIKKIIEIENAAAQDIAMYLNYLRMMLEMAWLISAAALTIAAIVVDFNLDGLIKVLLLALILYGSIGAFCLYAIDENEENLEKKVRPKLKRDVELRMKNLLVSLEAKELKSVYGIGNLKKKLSAL